MRLPGPGHGSRTLSLPSRPVAACIGVAMCTDLRRVPRIIAVRNVDWLLYVCVWRPPLFLGDFQPAVPSEACRIHVIVIFNKAS